MFTSRAEYRLLLRQDNADSRLSRLGYQIGLLPERHYRKFQLKERAVALELERLAKTRHGSDSLVHLLRRPELKYEDLPGAKQELSADVTQRVEFAVKYAGYVERQQSEVEKLRSLEEKRIPAAFDYCAVPSLRNEARQKLTTIRPATLGQASRISGVSPADLSILMVWLKRTAGTDGNETTRKVENTNDIPLETGEPD
jgi:tRNA uridine 5-carboxymethylaminomethyl modification enzyme